ncbi:MAG TPA: hypothetical protein VEK55_18060 [Xanthobacteraceae bacterium]|nr:hypothetical protein [Xanthobacteraceae bacterium]
MTASACGCGRTGAKLAVPLRVFGAFFADARRSGACLVGFFPIALFLPIVFRRFRALLTGVFLRFGFGLAFRRATIAISPKKFTGFLNGLPN